ncbi:ribosomal protein L4 [Microstroma glucosiphilum]|uniref:Large ribosomal subunit protein uL4m n=1 Tax=Pseudomicrostroma glucosiphilum TaxID=1684307 RepID=A0A316U8C9_9BASI|nr:ribosomal protein L4 [Pseudomicrostroma glucosiphilum]PWN20623.1 ribosomal protein L4 [Pseudomicrostroma glucosiphilum]
MKNVLRVGGQLRQAVASTSRLPAAARQLHGSTPLDPADNASGQNQSQTFGMFPPGQSSTQQGGLSVSDLAQAFAAGQASFSPAQDQTRVYTKLRHLHPSTKQPAASTSESQQYVPLSAHVFGTTPRRDILHSAIVYHLDSLRSGTASTKTRGEVNYSTRKIRPQKGTGNARLGSRGNPLLRGGGVAHGPKPRDFATELPRRVRELALRSALSARWREGKLHVIPSLYWDAPPRVTGTLRRALGSRGWEDTLFLTAPRSPQSAQKMGIRQRIGRPSALDPIYTPEQLDAHGRDVQNFAIALANIPNTEMIRLDLLTEEARQEAKKVTDKKKPGELPAYEVIKRKNTVLDLGAVEWLEEKLGGSIFHVEEGEEGSEAELGGVPQEEGEQPSLDELERLAKEEADAEGVEGITEEVPRELPTTSGEQRK